MAQLMPLPLTVSCFSKTQIGSTFLVPADRVVPDKGPINGCVCIYFCYFCIYFLCYLFIYMIVPGLDPYATWDVIGLLDVDELDGDGQLSLAWADACGPVRNRYRLPSPSANGDKGYDECACSICSTTAKSATRKETENSTIKLVKRLKVWRSLD